MITTINLTRRSARNFASYSEHSVVIFSLYQRKCAWNLGISGI